MCNKPRNKTNDKKFRTRNILFNMQLIYTRSKEKSTLLAKKHKLVKKTVEKNRKLSRE